MAKPKNGGLGRGFDSIFLDNTPEETGSVSMLRLSMIEPNPNQPRKQFDAEALAQLADSISAHGLIQPLVVRNTENEGYYQIIAGERRWRAAKMAGLSEVPVVIMDADDKKVSELSLIENLQRENLNAVEEAVGMKVLLEQYQLTQEELSRSIGKSRSAIANKLRLLDLPDGAVAMLKEGKLTEGHARALLGLKNPEDTVPLAELIEKKDLSVRQTEDLVRLRNKERAKAEESEEEPEGQGIHIDYIAALAEKMSKQMGRGIKIRNTGKNRRLEISYEDEEDLDAIVKLLCGDNIFDK